MKRSSLSRTCLPWLRGKFIQKKMLFREHLCLLNESDVTRLYKTNDFESCHTILHKLLTSY